MIKSQGINKQFLYRHWLIWINRSYGGDKMWEVYHNRGSTHVHAPSEAVAIQRFLAKYPDANIRSFKYKG